MVLSMILVGLLVGCAGAEAEGEEAAPETEEPSDGGPAVSDSEEGFEWTWIGSIPETSGHMAFWDEMCHRITERSDGRLVVTPQHLGQHPYGGADVPSVVRDNLAQMGHTEGTYVTGEDPFLGAMEQPFLVATLAQAEEVRDRWLSELLEPYLAEEWNQAVIGMFLVCGAGVHTRDVLLDSFEALQGMKLRVYNKETADLIKLTGAVPVTVAMKETYPALQKGVIDGGMTSMQAAYDFKWWEVCKYSTWWNFAFGSDFTVVNLDAFNELPSDLQAIVIDTGHDAQDELQEWINSYTTYAVWQGITQYHVTVTGLTPDFLGKLQDRVKPAVEDWASRCSGDLGHRFLEIAEEAAAT
jgi:TRAP-type C4-dicarboxylate transport system substrate-binding protein